MKRYNRVDRNTWILGILVPILLFFVSLNGTFSYFTASAQKHVSNTSTAILSIKVINDQVVVNSAAYTSQKIVPGDTLKFTGSLQNLSSIPVYVVAALNTVVTKTNTESVTLTKYYSRNNTTWVEIGVSNNKFNANSFEMAKDATLSFSFEQLLDGDDFNNDYFGANVKFTLSVFAIQTANITHEKADELLYAKATA